MRKQGAVIPIETIIAQGVVSKIPVKGQRLAVNLVRDIAWRKNDEEVALCDWERLSVVESSGDGSYQGSMRARCRAYRGVVIGKNPGATVIVSLSPMWSRARSCCWNW